MKHVELTALVVTAFSAAAASPVLAQDMAGPQVTVVDGAQAPGSVESENPIPPYVEGQAQQARNGGYCYGGPHPAPGGGWEASTAPHSHEYAPFDLRLFAYHDGCYYFIGDPRDFGYTGEAYSYYGAHPILENYGGGWCFMIGAHSHWWRPWSPYFTTVGPWYYWNGPYDPFFWSYWPYYSFYYRSYYPSYYAGGRYFHSWRAAPPITRVPATGWRGQPGGTGWRGAPPAAGGWRGSPAATAAPLHSGAGGGWRGAPAPGAGGTHAPGAGGGWHGSPVPTTPAPLHAAPGGGGWHAPGGGSFGGGWHAPPSGGGFRQPGGGFGGGWHAPPSGGGGGFHPAPAPSGGGWHGAPSGGGFRGGGSFGGGFRGGGGWHGGGRR